MRLLILLLIMPCLLLGMEGNSSVPIAEEKFDQYETFTKFPFYLKQEIAKAEWETTLDSLKKKREHILNDSRIINAAELINVDKSGHEAIQRLVMLKRVFANPKAATQEIKNILLWEASKNGLYMTAMMMIKLGANVNYISGRSGVLWTSLHVAALNGKADIVDLLLRSKATKTIRGYISASEPTSLDHTNGMKAIQIALHMWRGLRNITDKEIISSSSYREAFEDYKKIVLLLK